MKIKTTYPLLFIIFCVITSCKPTEKGYQAAYDAALHKREAAYANLQTELPQGTIQQVDGPQLKDIDGHQIYVENKRISPYDNNSSLSGEYNVAIARYKMSTNAISQVEQLREEGFQAVVAKDTEGNFFTLAGSFPTMNEAKNFYLEYQKKKKQKYVGLPDSPVIIYSPIK